MKVHLLCSSLRGWLEHSLSCKLPSGLLGTVWVKPKFTKTVESTFQYLSALPKYTAVSASWDSTSYCLVKGTQSFHCQNATLHCLVETFPPLEVGVFHTSHLAYLICRNWLLPGQKQLTTKKMNISEVLTSFPKTMFSFYTLKFLLYQTVNSCRKSVKLSLYVWNLYVWKIKMKQYNIHSAFSAMSENSVSETFS